MFFFLEGDGVMMTFLFNYIFLICVGLYLYAQHLSAAGTRAPTPTSGSDSTETPARD